MSETIKVGDKVRVSKDAPRIYTQNYLNLSLHNTDFEVANIEDGCANIQNKDGILTIAYVIPTKYLTKVEDEAKAKYKVGDKVRVLGHALLEGGVFTITFVEHREKRGWMYRINTHTWFPESDLAPYTEPTTPTIKVGDFVRVLENLHEPICLEGDLHLEITNVPPHAVSQKEWKVISVEMRRDCAGRIYTLKHDDSFIYNIPEDCVELVQPKEQTEETSPKVNHSDIDIDTIVARGYIPDPNSFFKCDWDAYTADLAKEIAVKLSDPNENKPGYVADYAVSVAKAVVENLKRK